jgi:hypothetical protein
MNEVEERKLFDNIRRLPDELKLQILTYYVNKEEFDRDDECIVDIEHLILTIIDEGIRNKNNDLIRLVFDSSIMNTFEINPNHSSLYEGYFLNKKYKVYGLQYEVVTNLSVDIESTEDILTELRKYKKLNIITVRESEKVGLENFPKIFLQSYEFFQNLRDLRIDLSNQVDTTLISEFKNLSSLSLFLSDSLKEIDLISALSRNGYIQPIKNLTIHGNKSNEMTRIFNLNKLSFIRTLELYWLDIRETHFENMNYLKELCLVEVNIQYNKLISIKSLEFLSLMYFPVEDTFSLDFLKEMKNLNTLLLKSIESEEEIFLDLLPLINLQNTLEDLKIYACPVKSTEPLSQLINLKRFSYLSILVHELERNSFMFLNNLTKLENIDLDLRGEYELKLRLINFPKLITFNIETSLKEDGEV